MILVPPSRGASLANHAPRLCGLLAAGWLLCLLAACQSQRCNCGPAETTSTTAQARQQIRFVVARVNCDWASVEPLLSALNARASEPTPMGQPPRGPDSLGSYLCEGMDSNAVMRIVALCRNQGLGLENSGALGYVPMTINAGERTIVPLWPGYVRTGQVSRKPSDQELARLEVTATPYRDRDQIKLQIHELFWYPTIRATHGLPVALTIPTSSSLIVVQKVSDTSGGTSVLVIFPKVLLASADEQK